MIKIIDYKAGNAPSVMHAIRHLGHSADFARSAADLEGATHIILPGVGSAGATMNSLRELDLLAPLQSAVLEQGVLFLGICVGMQVLFQHSEEEDTPCLGWLEGKVVKFDRGQVRVPQMGWNKVDFVKPTPCTPKSDDYFYFVNSYYAKPTDGENIWGQTDYNGTFASAVQKGNVYGTQFHVEKSGKAGLALLERFICLQKD
ncbi:MAG: imidazole glycerol phosphate synthase subunit HisH [Oscillospiraceae bacterium]|nr:imidazole glycerol phosphate synthase subunit HisH [Oscillospiraceae bacterium]